MSVDRSADKQEEVHRTQDAAYAVEKALDDKPEDEATQTIPPRSIHGVKWLIVVMSSLVVVFLFGFDITITADIVPYVVESFPEDTDLLVWLGVGYALGKYLYMFGLVNFAAGSALCGGAPTMDAEIVGRVWSGVGAQIAYAGVVRMFSLLTTNAERPMYIGLIGMCWGVGAVLGAIIGGAFATTVGWRWALYFTPLLMAVFVPSYLFLTPSFDMRPGQSLRRRLHRLDYVGMVLNPGALLAVVMAINFGGALYRWDSGNQIALVVVAGLSFLLFLAQQVCKWFTDEENRLVPLHILRDKENILVFIAACAGNCNLLVPLFYVPLYFQFSKNDSGLEAGVRMLPMMFALLISVAVSGAVLSKTGYYKPYFVIGPIIALVGAALFTIVEVDTNVGAPMGYGVLVMFGMAFYAQHGYAILQSLVDPIDVGGAAALMNFAQVAGNCFGLAIAGAIFFNEAINRISAVLPITPPSQVRSLVTGAGASFIAQLPAATRVKVLEAIVEAVQRVYISVAVSAAVSLVCGVLMQWQKIKVA